MRTLQLMLAGLLAFVVGACTVCCPPCSQCAGGAGGGGGGGGTMVTSVGPGGQAVTTAGSDLGLSGLDLDGAVINITTASNKYVWINYDNANSTEVTLDFTSDEELEMVFGDEYGVDEASSPGVHEWLRFGELTAQDTLRLEIADLTGSSSAVTVTLTESDGTTHSKSLRAFGAYDSSNTDSGLSYTYVGRHPDGRRIVRVTIVHRGRSIEFTLRQVA